MDNKKAWPEDYWVGDEGIDLNLWVDGEGNRMVTGYLVESGLTRTGQHLFSINLGPEPEKIEVDQRGRGVIKDALYYLDPTVANNEKHIAQARGQLNGIVSAVMATKGLSFDRAVRAIVPYLPDTIEWEAVPPPWRDTFKEAIKEAMKPGSMKDVTQDEESRYVYRTETGETIQVTATSWAEAIAEMEVALTDRGFTSWDLTKTRRV